MKNKWVFKLFFGGVLLGALLSGGCGGGGSSGGSSDPSSPTTIGDSVIAPFGAESIVYVQYDVEDNWTERSASHYSYDEEGRVTTVTITTEWDDNKDGIPDAREVTTTVIDPTIVLPEMDVRVFAMAIDMGGSSYTGAVLSMLYERYSPDPDGTLQLTETRTRAYQYDSSGNITRREETSQRDDNGDYILDLIEKQVAIMTYDASGRILSREESYERDVDGDGTPESESTSGWVFEYDSYGNEIFSQNYYDSDGDGNNDSVVTNTYTYVYDAQGNLTLLEYLFEADDNGDGSIDRTSTRITTYVNSYDPNNNLIRVVKSESGGIYTYDFTYDGSGRVTSRTETNDYDGNGEPDDINIYTFSYNDLEQLIGYSQTLQEYRLSDPFLMIYSLFGVDRDVYTYTYDAEGTLTSIIQVSTSDRTSPTLPPTGAPDYQRTYTTLYNYDADGHLIDYSQVYEEDQPVGGVVESASSDGFSAGFTTDGTLASFEQWQDLDDNGVDDYLNKYTFTFNADGQVLTKVYENDTNFNGVTDYFETTSYTYDDSGLLTTVSEQINDRGVVSEGMSGTFTYSGNLISANLDMGDGGGPAEFELDYSIEGVPVGVSAGERLYSIGVTTPGGGYSHSYEYIAPSPDIMALLLGTTGDLGGGGVE